MKATPAYSSLNTRSTEVEDPEGGAGEEVAMSVVTTPSAPATLSATPVATQAGLVSESVLETASGVSSEDPDCSSTTSSTEGECQTMSIPQNTTRSLMEMILGSEIPLPTTLPSSEIPSINQVIAYAVPTASVEEASFISSVRNEVATATDLASAVGSVISSLTEKGAMAAATGGVMGGSGNSTGAGESQGEKSAVKPDDEKEKEESGAVRRVVADLVVVGVTAVVVGGMVL